MEEDLRKRTRFKPECLHFAFIISLPFFLLAVTISVAVGFVFLQHSKRQFDADVTEYTSDPNNATDKFYSVPNQLDTYLVPSPCHIPDIDLRHPNITRLIHPMDSVTCSTLPPLTEVRGQSLTLMRERVKLYVGGEGRLQCCWQEVTREDAEEFTLEDEVDNVYNVSKCLPLDDSLTLTSEQQFISVKCVDHTNKEVYTNAHAVVPIRKDIMEKIRYHNISSKQDKMNVLVIGIDSISQGSLITAMPRTRQFLKKMSWVKMRGYNKVARNTFPNLLAILTGLGELHLGQSKEGYGEPVDDYPFLWKSFSDEGYTTAYAEDEPFWSTFNCKNNNGFLKTPTDYYLRPFLLAAQNHTELKMISKLTVCLGPTLSIDHILNYASDFAKAFQNQSFFGLFWVNTLGHQDVKAPFAIDLPFLNFFYDLTKSGVLNSTFVLFLSDHGVRRGETCYYAGWLEERLPFIFVWVPEWYKKRYPEKYSSIIVNRNRLTSPFDLHLTLKEVLTGKHEIGTPSCPSCLSLFKKVPFQRSCLHAGVPQCWTTCFSHPSKFSDVNECPDYV